MAPRGAALENSKLLARLRELAPPALLEERAFEPLFFRYLGFVQASDGIIASLFGLTVHELTAKLEEGPPEILAALVQGRAEGQITLLDAQAARALGKDGGRPSEVMQIWNGKQHLSQADKSFLETKWQGRLELIPQEELDALVLQAKRVVGGKVISARTVSADALPPAADAEAAENVRSR